MENSKQEASLLGAVPGLHVSSSYWADPNQPVCEDANFSGNLRAGRGGVGPASNGVRIWIVAAAERLLGLFPNPSFEGILFCPKIETLCVWALGRHCSGFSDTSLCLLHYLSEYKEGILLSLSLLGACGLHSSLPPGWDDCVHVAALRWSVSLLGRKLWEMFEKPPDFCQNNSVCMWLEAIPYVGSNCSCVGVFYI